MGFSSYNRQQLAVYAAGHINAAGDSSQSFGLGLTRLATGVYAAVFGADSGLVNDQSYTYVTTKGTSATPPLSITVEDTSNLVKTIFVQSATGGPGQLQEAGLEVAIYRTVTQGA